MDFFPQPPPQPMDSDRINEAFDNLGGDEYGASTRDLHTGSGLDGGAWQDAESDYYAPYAGEDENGFQSVPVVDDYSTEMPEEESEGWAYNAEKRRIRKTVDLGDSNLFMWGEGTHGKLGHNSRDSLYVPFVVAATTKIPIRMCALGRDHSVLLAVEGYVLTCGSNAYGQLGTGDHDNSRLTLTLVQSATDVRSIASGHYHTLALMGTGKVMAWGGGSWGKLGLSSDANVKTPRLIAALQASIVDDIACGAHHSACISSTGDVWTWGKGLRGQLGHNSVKEEYTPRICALLRKAGAEQICCGDDHTLILLNNGHLFAMGANHCGQLGLGDTVDRGVPTPVIAFADEHIADVAASHNGSLALTNAGRVFTFGNSEIEVGCRLPRHVYTLPKADPIVSIAKDASFDYAVSDTGNLFRWPASDTNWDGDGKTETESFHAIKGVLRIYTGQNHVAVICTSDMGCTQAMISRDKSSSFSNDISKASLEKFPEESTQTPMSAVAEYLDNFNRDQIFESVSREGDGTLYTYGKGNFGRLGHGLEYTRCEESVRHPKKVEILARMSINDICCGKDATAAVTDTGQVFTWGKASMGKLGVGSKHDSMVVQPRRVERFHGMVIVRVSVGRNHMAAMSDSHRFFTWGSNTFGQLGMPNISKSSSVPVELRDLGEKRIRHFACGGWHTIVCSWNGSVYSCGKGWHGQLGQGDYESLTAQSKALPYFKRVSGGLGDSLVMKVFGGKETSAALSEAGRVFTWGLGDHFQLGHGRADNESVPKEVEVLSKVKIVDLALGDYHMLALDEAGNPFSWGNGGKGQLGQGELCENESKPRMISLCRRGSMVGFREVVRDLPWGSFYVMKDKEPGEEEEVEVEFTQAGKVCMIAAEGSYSLFVLKRLANKGEVRRYKEAVERNDHEIKKMTEMTVIHELFGCGCGKGGVLQSVGKENEFIPKLLSRLDTGELMQDVVKVSAGQAHVGVVLRDDPLRNIECGNLQDMELQDKKSNKARQVLKASQDLELAVLEEENEVSQEDVDPFALASNDELEHFLHTCTPSQEKWLQTMTDHDLDLETLSSIHDDETLKELGVEVLGARRRLLKEVQSAEHGMQEKFPPLFYSYTNAEWVYLSWPPRHSHGSEEALKSTRFRAGARAQNPFTSWLKQKASAKIFRALVRYAETKHFDEIRDRSNKRYEADPDGSYKVWTWGVGVLGRLGHGYNVSYATPTVIDGFPPQTKVVEIACGAEHTLARTFDGAVLAWGNGDRGQLGTTENFHGIGVNNLVSPQAIPVLKRFFVVTIAAGRWHNMALSSDRQVYVWGAGHFGQLGLDNNDSHGVPQLVRGLDGRAVSKCLCGGWHSAVITETGKMMLWGKNTHGQLGVGDTKSTNFPKINQSLRYQGKIRTGVLGANHTLVVMVMNRVFAFGDNQFGQLGVEGSSRHPRDSVLEPREIVDLHHKNICQVAAGDQHSIALSVFGEVWAWGGSPYGQLGHGGITDISRPTPLLEHHNIPPDIKSIACGYTFSAALSKNGEVYTWGQGESGELGHPAKVLMYAPTRIEDFGQVARMACGQRHMGVVQFTPRALKGGVGDFADPVDPVGLASGPPGSSRYSASGTASPRSIGQSSRRTPNTSQTRHQKTHGVCMIWGEDTCGQLGMRGLQSARSPTVMQMMMGHNVVQTAAHSDVSAFVTEQGQVFMCGSGDEGRLGLGHLGMAPSPTEVRALSASKIVKIACGFGHTLALSHDSRVFAWGEGTWGNVGICNSSEILEPLELHTLATVDVVSIHAGGFHSGAITRAGQLYTWGKNTNGQLGVGTVSSSEECPTKVTAVTGIVKDVSLGRNHTAIMMQVTPPNIFTCGLNGNGQLGHEDFVDRCDPMPVIALDDRMIISVSCGSAHTAAVSQHGDLIVWGNGRNGQLGLFSGLDRDHEGPVQLPNFSEDQLVHVVCGQEITCALTDRGDIYMCGRESAVGLGGSAAKNATDPTVPRLVEGISNISCLSVGSVHVIALFPSNLDADA